MAISKSHAKKSPSQHPTAFYKGEQSGSRDGKGGATVPDKLTGGALREQIYGRKSLK